MRYMSAAICAALMFCSGEAYATATFDYLSEVKITFNYTWIDYTPTITSNKDGTGQYSASTLPSTDYKNNRGQTWFYQSVQIAGSAGDASFTNSGIAHADGLIDTLLTFNFGTPSDLTVWLSGYNQSLTSSKALPLWNPQNQTGEYVGYWAPWGGGGTGVGLKFDGQGFAIPNWTVGNYSTFYGLTGLHTILIHTSASETAIAGYPYIPTPEPASLLLLGLSLIGIARFRRRIK